MTIGRNTLEFNTHKMLLQMEGMFYENMETIA